MSDIIISPQREKGDPRLPAAGILLLNPSEASFALTRAKAMGGRQHFLFNSRLVHVPTIGKSREFFVAGPAVGAPMAVITLEKLVALGCRFLIACGWCGSFSPDFPAGSRLLPTWAVCDEGTSAHYPINSQPRSSPEARNLLAASLAQQGIKTVEGPVWTTDAPYRESRDEVKSLAQKGIVAVDMEFSALATVSLFRKIRLAALLMVSDELWGDNWNPEYRNKNFKESSRATVSALMQFCRACSPAEAT